MSNGKSDNTQSVTIIRPIADFSKDRRFAYQGRWWRCKSIRIVGAGKLELVLCDPRPVESDD
ncbi:hypothetical protein [Paracoccus sediminilitoris]|uniref:hypothetical protein n=1 Tax=Paracoccus sediminilitoris TaxID=2202419 RepID=UPI0011B947C3|nr:hypothetical protein [Paracoccus sediminilitoris]